MQNKRYTRREFLRNASLTALGSLTIPLFSSCTKEEAEDFLQKHFREMTPEEKKRVIAKLEQRYFQKYGRKFQISTQEAVPEYLLGIRPGAFPMHRVPKMCLCLCERK